MMELYRIAKCQYIDDLSGTGAKTYGGRWNSKGYPVVYTAGSRSLAALETLVHVPQKNIPPDLCIVTLSIPSNIEIQEVALTSLPKEWKSIPIHHTLQKTGDEWLQTGKTAILQVPSVVIPEEFNYLINPLHPNSSKIKIKEENAFAFDERIGGQ